MMLILVGSIAMPVGESISIVVCDGLFVLGAYRDPNLAHTHARTVTGASVLLIELRSELPESVIDVLGGDFEDDDTPVITPPRSRSAGGRYPSKG